MIWEKWLAWRSLDPEERRLVARAWWMLLAARVGLRVARYQSVDARLGLWAGRPIVTDPEVAARAVDIAAGNQPGSVHCLPRAMVLHGLLRRAGLPSLVRFGVRHADGGEIEAHAWVEVGGRPVGEAGAARDRPYSVLESAPAGVGRAVPPAAG